MLSVPASPGTCLLGTEQTGAVQERFASNHLRQVHSGTSLIQTVNWCVANRKTLSVHITCDSAWKWHGGGGCSSDTVVPQEFQQPLISPKSLAHEPKSLSMKMAGLFCSPSKTWSMRDWAWESSCTTSDGEVKNPEDDFNTLPLSSY